MYIGYARVSTQDQRTDLQIAALKEAECKKIYEDQLSGLRADRPDCKNALDQLREGDTFVV
jgi:DNA invertase Pin-like site-specific DNA recombinase